MRTRIAFLVVAALLAASALVPNLHAQPLVNIETVTVGDPGNAADNNGYGAVAHTFSIGKYEITIAQYTAFLNSVAAVNPAPHVAALWNPNMASDFTVAGITRQGNGTAESPFFYEINTNRVVSIYGTSEWSSSSKPISYVSWFDAARFCNWLHNGATNGANTETGAYQLSGATTGLISKSPEARWWIPTEDEWYKAAYYKGGGTNVGYWLYAMQSNEQPDNKWGATLPIIENGVMIDVITLKNQANFKTKTWSTHYFASDYYVKVAPLTFWDHWYYLTDVGSFSNSSSAYGTFDQTGNLSEWNDAMMSQSEGGWVWEARGVRGGYWNDIVSTLRTREELNPTTELPRVGFRIASSVEQSLDGQPFLRIEEPAGNAMLSNAAAKTFGNLLAGTASAGRAYIIRNTGAGPLTSIALAKVGSHTNDFAIIGPGTNALAPGASTTFSVSFAPNTGGTRTAQVSITSNDTNRSPFLINVSGFGIGSNRDTDKDGLNDAAEFLMSGLGFNWRAAQPELVGVLTTNANTAGFFTKAQHDANFAAGRVAGRSDVTNNPASYRLVSRTNIPPVRIAMPRGAAFTVNLGGTNWTRYAQSGMPTSWSFNTNTGALSGLTPTSGERNIRITPYNSSQAGPQMIIQLRPAP